MFNMKQIGKKITELRKKNNMTQMELADILGISFQAVSNCGNTMPDVSKLPELATIFHVSIDELLNGNSALIESIIEGTVDTYIDEGKLTEDEVSDVLPLLKPNQAKDILEKTNVSSFENISTFLPHLDADFIAELAINALENGNNIDYFLPYMYEDDVTKLATLTFEKGLPIDNFLPHIDEFEVAKLANLAFEKGLAVDNFLPFMDEGDVTELALKALKKK